MPCSRSLPPRVTRYAERHPRRFLLALGALAVASVLVLVWGFAAIADAVPEHGRMDRFDMALTAFIQAHDTEWGEAFFHGISYLGPPTVYAAVVAGVAYYARRRDWLRAGTVLACGGGGMALNNVLKTIFHRGRPESAVEFITRPSWSFPSGHAMDAVTTYGILLLLATESIQPGARRRWTIGLTVLVIVLVGVSRVYLGVHYLSDVIGGWLAGGAWLVASVAGYQLMRRAPDGRASEPLR
jgi:membrane-associated phospholipid phosphatase